MGKTVSIVFDPIFFMLAGNEGMHESSEEFEVRPDLTPPTVELAALERLEKSPKCCHFFSAVLDRIHFILTGNNDIH